MHRCGRSGTRALSRRSRRLCVSAKRGAASGHGGELFCEQNDLRRTASPGSEPPWRRWRPLSRGPSMPSGAWTLSSLRFPPRRTRTRLIRWSSTTPCSHYAAASGKSVRTSTEQSGSAMSSSARTPASCRPTPSCSTELSTLFRQCAKLTPTASLQSLQLTPLRAPSPRLIELTSQR